MTLHVSLSLAIWWSVGVSCVSRKLLSILLITQKTGWVVNETCAKIRMLIMQNKSFYSFWAS